MRVRGLRLLQLAALPVLAVSVSIGAVMPSAPFDAWSPPPVSIQRGARPVEHPSSAPRERGAPSAGPLRPGATDAAAGDGPRPAASPLVASLVDRPEPQAVRGTPIAREAVSTPGWALSWWRGAASGPLRAPPRLPAT